MYIGEGGCILLACGATLLGCFSHVANNIPSSLRQREIPSVVSFWLIKTPLCTQSLGKNGCLDEPYQFPEKKTTFLGTIWPGGSSGLSLGAAAKLPFDGNIQTFSFNFYYRCATAQLCFFFSLTEWKKNNISTIRCNLFNVKRMKIKVNTFQRQTRNLILHSPVFCISLVEVDNLLVLDYLLYAHSSQRLEWADIVQICVVQAPWIMWLFFFLFLAYYAHTFLKHRRYYVSFACIFQRKKIKVI